jgi:hypothetical protein
LVPSHKRPFHEWIFGFVMFTHRCRLCNARYMRVVNDLPKKAPRLSH